MNPQETQQVASRDEKWVPSAERVKISSTNIRLETTVPQKEETFQVIIDIIKNSTCFKAFTSTDVLESFIAANLGTILEICPRVEGVDFTDVPDDETALTFLIDLGYKKRRGKGLKGKKTAEESQETVDVFKKSKPEPESAKKKTSCKRRVKKKVTLSANDNIIFDDPDAALELANFISQTEAEEAEAARKVHATHARIMTESVPKSAKMKSSGRNEDVEMKDAEGEESDKGEEKVTDAAKEEAERLQKKRMMPKRPKSLHQAQAYLYLQVLVINFLNFSFDFSLVKTANLLPIPEIVTKTPVSTTDPSPQVTPIILTIQQTTTPIPSPTITTDAPTITTVVPASNALSAIELRVAKLEKDVSELKNVDHSFEALAVLLSQVLTVVDSYLDTKVEDLTKKPTPTAKQEFEKSPLEILKIKKEQAEKQKKLQFTIKNLPIIDLLRALMETLIKDENAMDKGVADTVKDHKRKHDNDEDPPAGPNQGKKIKRRRIKESESSKKSSTTKETPKDKTPTKGSKTGKSASAKEPVEEPIVRLIMDDAA
ncbi:hypothetical protein Tco_0359237 [Tanacetum coccineum]